MERCGLLAHNLGKYGEPMLIERQFLDIAKQINKDFTISTMVCRRCYIVLIQRTTAARKRLAEKSSTTSTSSLDEYDRMVAQTPKNPSLRRFAKDGNPMWSKENVNPQASQRSSSLASAPASGNIHTTADIDLSPNATNGTRLPHVQPIIKKSGRNIPDDSWMNEYIADITGG